MSDTQPQGTPVSMEKVLEKLKIRLADQMVQLAMYESYIEAMNEAQPHSHPEHVPTEKETFSGISKIEDN